MQIGLFLSLSVTFGFLQLLWEFSFLPFCQRLGSKLGLTRKLPFECPQTAKWKYKCWDTWNLGDNTKTGPTHIWFIQGSKFRFLKHFFYIMLWRWLKQFGFENRGFVWDLPVHIHTDTFIYTNLYVHHFLHISFAFSMIVNELPPPPKIGFSFCSAAFSTDG